MCHPYKVQLYFLSISKLEKKKSNRVSSYELSEFQREIIHNNIEYTTEPSNGVNTHIHIEVVPNKNCSVMIFFS